MSFFSSLRPEQPQRSNISTELGYLVNPQMGDAINPKVKGKRKMNRVRNSRQPLSTLVNPPLGLAHKPLSTLSSTQLLSALVNPCQPLSLISKCAAHLLFSNTHTLTHTHGSCSSLSSLVWLLRQQRSSCCRRHWREQRHPGDSTPHQQLPMASMLSGCCLRGHSCRACSVPACLHLDPVPQHLQELDFKLVCARQRERHTQWPDLQEVVVPHA